MLERRFLLDRGFSEVDFGVSELLGQHGVGTLPITRTIVPVDGLNDLIPHRQGHFDLAIEDEAKLFLGINVCWVARGNPQSRPLFIERNDGVFPGHALGHQIDDIVRNHHAIQIDERHAIDLRHHLHHPLGIGVAQPQHLLVQHLA